MIRILLVDDEPAFIEPIAAWLKAKGYDVAMVHNGVDALERIKKDAPDIVFLDINMPGKDGLQVFEEIRSFNKELPVVMLTAAFGDEKVVARARQLGIGGFFTKNYTLDQLLPIIQGLLKSHKKLRSSSEDDPRSA